MDKVTTLKYQGNYPIKMERRFLGIDMNMEGEECFEHRLYLYMGELRLDITDMVPQEVSLAVCKLELMGFGKQEVK